MRISDLNSLDTMKERQGRKDKLTYSAMMNRVGSSEEQEKVSIDGK